MEPFAEANDNYEALTRATYVADPADTSIQVTAIPANLPTLVTVGWNTQYQTVFRVTGTSGSSSANYALTGVTRVKGYDGNLPEGLNVNCLNHEEFFNQYSDAIGDINDFIADIEGSFVDTESAQTLLNKTLDAPTTAFRATKSHIATGNVFGNSNKKLLNFVPRDLTATWDYFPAAGTFPGNGHSLQSIVGTTAVRARIKAIFVGVSPIDIRARVAFAKGGLGIGAGTHGDARTVELSVLALSSGTDIDGTGAANLAHEFDVDLSATQTIDVNVDVFGGAGSNLRLAFVVTGWYEPAGV